MDYNSILFLYLVKVDDIGEPSVAITVDEVLDKFRLLYCTEKPSFEPSTDVNVKFLSHYLDDWAWVHFEYYLLTTY